MPDPITIQDIVDSAGHAHPVDSRLKDQVIKLPPGMITARGVDSPLTAVAGYIGRPVDIFTEVTLHSTVDDSPGGNNGKFIVAWSSYTKEGANQVLRVHKSSNETIGQTVNIEISPTIAAEVGETKKTGVAARPFLELVEPIAGPRGPVVLPLSFIVVVRFSTGVSPRVSAEPYAQAGPISSIVFGHPIASLKVSAKEFEASFVLYMPSGTMWSRVQISDSLARVPTIAVDVKIA